MDRDDAAWLFMLIMAVLWTNLFNFGITSSYHDRDMNEFQAQAVKRGYGAYKPDSNNKPEFEWINREAK